MRHHAGPVGEIITFYSYKGGTGRSMALANVACLLAKRSSVLMIDWDLEAPGLHRYFRDLLQERFPGQRAGDAFDQSPGLIDYFIEARRLIREGGGGETEASARALLDQIPLERFTTTTDVPSLSLFKAGRFHPGYSAAVSTFDWEELHNLSPWLFRAFAQLLAERYGYVLIDSRTGITDTSGICTSILPDVLVPVFTPNRQSLVGAVEMAEQAALYRKDSDDLRRLRIFPLASRIEGAEPVLRDLWRFGGPPEQNIPGYQPAFESLFKTVYDLPGCDLAGYFSEIQVQHIPRFAYGEQIAVHIESGDRLSLTRSYEGFVERLRSPAAPWEAPEEDTGRSVLEAAPARQEAWTERQRAFALPKLQDVDSSGWMEASFFLPSFSGKLGQKALLQAAQAGQVPGVGWPIGAVIATTSEFRPRPTQEGITAEIIDRIKPAYDYWSLRDDGAFYFVRNLEEDPQYLLADDRVERISELLLYCTRLYSSLGLDPELKVRIAIVFKGLSGRELGMRKAEDPERLYALAGKAANDSARAEVVVKIDRIQQEIIPLVKELSRPLFLLFNFYELSDPDYRRLISARLQNWGFPRSLTDASPRTPA